jgi:23S rRNA (uracil1939-C5)-methyltransferase
LSGDAGRAIEIERIASGGDGVGHLADGRVVFVPGTAPGDRVEVRIRKEAKRWARGEVRRIVEPGPDRREPPCPFAGRCGGCVLEHLEYPAQLRAKSRMVRDALQRLGGLEVEMPEVVASPEETRYRSRVSFTFKRLSQGRVVAGFHAQGAPGRIVDVDGRCLLPEPAIAEAWDALRAAWGPDAQRLPSGETLRLTLRGTDAGRVVLRIDGGGSPGRPEELLEAVPALAAIWQVPEGGAPRLLAGAEEVTDHWSGDPIRMRSGAFTQVNRGAAALLEAHVLERAGEVAGRTVVDAYAGIGVFGRRLAERGATVVGIELDPEGAAEAKRLAPEGYEVAEGRVEELLPRHLPADLVILNPPRGGVDERVAEALREAPPARLIYVSCDPATLARDLKRLGDGFEVADVRAFDLFPQTAHVETVVELPRGGDG